MPAIVTTSSRAPRPRRLLLLRPASHPSPHHPHRRHQPPTHLPHVPSPPLSTILQSNTPTLQHVPKGARDCWAKAHSDCLLAVALNTADLSQWSRLFMLPKCVLASPAAGHRLRWREMKSRLRRWSAGDLVSLWSEALASGKSLFKRSEKSSSPAGSPLRGNRNTNIRRAKAAVQDGQYNKALKALTSDGLAPPTPEVLQEMLNKHPQDSLPATPPGPAPPTSTLSEAAIKKGVRSFPNGSAPGPSGLRPSHVREAVDCPSPDRANNMLSSLTKFVNHLAAGQAPPSILPHLCGATLLAIRKKNGGLRPIAAGEVLCRLVSKCLATATRTTALSLLAPLQLGVGARGGCEAIIHATSHLMATSPTNHRWSLLLDFSNAFNNISRESMFVEIRRHIPSLSVRMEACYSCQPLLHLGENSIHSCRGFALTLHPIVEHIKAKVPGLALNTWYLDDGTLIGHPEDLATALHIIEREGPSVGLHLNRGKSLLFIPEEADATQSPLPSDIPVTRCGFSLLGCPIRPPSFCEQVFQNRVTKVRTSLGALQELGGSQLESTLLRSCLALPKVSFVLRTCPPSHICQAAKDFDTAVRETLESILSGPLPEWSWLKASLPSTYGGLNLRSALLHAPAAFLGSSVRSQPLVERILGRPADISPHTSPAVAALATAAARPDWQCLDDIDVPLRQHPLSLTIDKASHQNLLSSSPSIRSRALALSSSLPHAGDWLNVVPSPSLGLHLQDREFRRCLRYWLGVPLYNSSYSCPECHGTADPFRDHQVGCGGNGDRISRHNSIRDVVFCAAQSAALAPSKETPNLVPNSQSRPADILIPNWSRGRPAALDVHVISPLQRQTLGQAASTPGHTLEVGTRRKLASHLSACRSVGVEFIPLVTETLGGLSGDTINTIRSLGLAIEQRTGSPNSTKHLFKSLAVALW